MKEVLQSPLFGIVLSVFAFQVGLFFNKKTGSPLCNPLLIAVALIIAVIKIFHIPLEWYQKGGDVIAIFLAPATACLALSVYGQIKQLKRHLLPVVAGCFMGSCASVISVIALCRLFGLDETMTASAVIFTGILGAIIAPLLVKLLRVKEPVEKGVAIGTCSHAIGTTKALEMGEMEGAMSGISIGVAGIATVIICLFL